MHHSSENELALTCGAEGLYLGETPLVAKGADGLFRPCAPALLKRYLAGREGGLIAVANALNRGQEACAIIAALHMRLTEPDRRTRARTRLNLAFQRLAKYDPNQPRVPAGNPDGGEWTSGGGSGGTTSASRHHAPSWGERLLGITPAEAQEEDEKAVEEQSNLSGELRIAELKNAQETLAERDPGNPMTQSLSTPGSVIPSRSEIDAVWAEVARVSRNQVQNLINNGDASNCDIPDDWLSKVTDKEDGIKFTNPDNPRDNIRFMMGNPTSDEDSQRVPYVKDQINGKFLTTEGNRVQGGKSGDVHIPYWDYKGRQK